METEQSIDLEPTFNRTNLFIWIHPQQRIFLYFPLQSKYFQTYYFKVLGRQRNPNKTLEQDTVLRPTFNKMNLSIRIHPHRPTQLTSRSPARNITLWNQTVKGSKPQPEINPAHGTWNLYFVLRRLYRAFSSNTIKIVVNKTPASIDLVTYLWQPERISAETATQRGGHGNRGRNSTKLKQFSV